MIIVGVTGGIGSGKTTFAEFLATNTQKTKHFESWLVIAEVANAWRSAAPIHPDPQDFRAINDWLRPLSSIVTSVCNKPVEFDQLELTPERLKNAPDSYAKLLEYLELMLKCPELQKGQITQDSKETYRSLLQWLGGYFEKNVAAGTWYDEIVRRIQQTRDVDLATVGGVRFLGDARRIARAGGKIICIDRPDISLQDANEITEREQKLIVPDATVINDAGLPELGSVAAKIWKDLQKNQLVTEYITSKIQA